ncbi:MAG: DUF4440 domain-containing protein [Saprospiraceae bacterium]
MEAFATAWKKGDAEVSASYFTEDAINIHPVAEPDSGRAETLKMSINWLQTVIVQKLDFQTHELDQYGDYAYESGTFIQEVQPRKGGKGSSQNGRYFAVWRYDGDGQWKIKRFIFD